MIFVKKYVNFSEKEKEKAEPKSLIENYVE